MNKKSNNVKTAGVDADILKLIETLEACLLDNGSCNEDTECENAVVGESNSPAECGESIVDMLTRALADEWLASYQYWVCANLARGNGRTDAIDEFSQHEKEEKDHADKLMLRIKELGGKPIFNPCDWAKIGNPWTVVETTDVCAELDITIKAEEDAIAYYNKVIDCCRGVDEVSMRLCRSILADECEHLYDLQMLKEEFCG